MPAGLRPDLGRSRERRAPLRAGALRAGALRAAALLCAASLAGALATGALATGARAAGGGIGGGIEGGAEGGIGGGGDGEWPRFRGPRGSATGDADSVPAEFTKADFNWVATLPGTGRSSVVTWDGRLFVTSAEADPGKRHLLCLGARDGREVWRRSFDFRPRRIHTLNSHAASTPAVDARGVYLVMTDPESVNVVALDHAGRERWRRDLGPFRAQHGPGASPVAVGGTLLLGNDQEGNESFLVGLDCATGEVRWKRKRRNSKAAYSTPLELVRGDGDREDGDREDGAREDGGSEAVFTSTSHGFTSVDPATGRLLWEAEGVFRERCVSSPVAASGLVFATAGTGGAGREAVAVRPPAVEGGRAEVAYRIRSDLPYVPTPLAAGDLLYLLNDGGRLTCARASTGEALWREDVGLRCYASPVCAGGRIYLVSRKGEVLVIAASDRYEVLGRSSLGEASYATPAVAGGVMYFRTESRVISLGGRR